MADLAEMFKAVFRLLNDKGVIDDDEYKYIAKTLNPYGQPTHTIDAVYRVIDGNFIVGKREVRADE